MSNVGPVILKDVSSNDELLKHLNKYANGKLSVVLFTASWCGPCKKIKGEIYNKGSPGELSVKYKDDVCFFYIDIETNPKLADEYGINAVPVFYFLICKGKDVEFHCPKINGGDKGKIVREIDGYLDSL